MTSGNKSTHPSKVEKEGPHRVYDGFFKIDKYNVRHELFNGSLSGEQPIEVFERGDSVAALLFDPIEEEVVLVNQFRLPTMVRGGGTGWLIETAAGMIKSGESPEACLQREVIEEVGYQVTELSEIARFFSSPGGSSERIYLYYAEIRIADKVSAGGGKLLEGEDIRIERLRLETFFQKLSNREFEDPKLIIAGQWLKSRRANLPAEPSALVSHTVEYRVTGTENIIGYKTGNIIAVKDVDVWVNPEDTDMMMDRFNGRSVSATIRYHGAEKFEDNRRIKIDTIANALREQCRHNFVRLTTIVDTTAGELQRTNNVKRIFHVAVVPGSFGEGLNPRAETLEACMDRVLEEVERKNQAFFGRANYRSVLIPILGTGQGRFFTKDVAPRLVERALKFFEENKRARLNNIYFCAYSSGDREMLEEIFRSTEQLERFERGQTRSSAASF
jgi:nudix-type nucleoside diphosphatase (YffH/AdpP family)